MSEDLTITLEPGTSTLEPETVTPELDRDLESVAENVRMEPSGGAAADPPIMSVAHVTDSPLLPQRRFVKPKLVPERADKRQKTKVVLDAEDASTHRNLSVPLNSLLRFLEENFCCWGCRRQINISDDGYYKPLGLEVFGVACGLNFNCVCGATAASLRPKVVAAARIAKLKTLQVGKPYGTRVNAGDFELNRRLVLGLQLCGNGQHDATNIAGMLNLNVNPMKNKWTDTQELIGKAIILVGSQVLEENLAIEAEMSPVAADGRRGLAVCSDTRWDKRGSSRQYDSLSGCSVFIGLRANMPIGIECMSSVCIKCTKGLSHEVDVCPKNYTGTAKGMESYGAAKIAQRIFNNPSIQVYIHSLVTDDDSSVRRILTHSFKKKVDAGRMAASDWPRHGKNETGGKKPDVGLLPLLHAEIVFLADKGHRNPN
jgi:hypothetical protein